MTRINSRHTNRLLKVGRKRIASPFAAPPVDANHVRCPVCLGAASTTSRGVLRRHLEPGGDPCLNRAVSLDMEGIEAPAVVFPQQSTNGNLLSPTGYCHECGKAITGERKFCGRCAANRNRQ